MALHGARGFGSAPLERFTYTVSALAYDVDGVIMIRTRL